MALETLKGKYVPEHVYVDHDNNQLIFTIQKGPMGREEYFCEGCGNDAVAHPTKNGCQVDDLIDVARTILAGLDQNYPCRENALALVKLEEALMWLGARTKDRESRGVEGTSQA